MAALLAAADASGQSSRRAQLIYVKQPGTESCPEEEALRSAVSGRLGRDPFAANANLTIHALVERSATSLVGRIELRDHGGRVLGRREIASPASDCRELGAAMALAISVAIDPLAAMRVAPVPAPAPAPSAPPTAEVRPPPLAPRPLEVSAGLLASLGDAPALSPG